MIHWAHSDSTSRSGAWWRHHTVHAADTTTQCVLPLDAGWSHCPSAASLRFHCAEQRPAEGRWCAVGARWNPVKRCVCCARAAIHSDRTVGTHREGASERASIQHSAGGSTETGGQRQQRSTKHSGRRTGANRTTHQHTAQRERGRRIDRTHSSILRPCGFCMQARSRECRSSRPLQPRRCAPLLGADRTRPRQSCLNSIDTSVDPSSMRRMA